MTLHPRYSTLRIGEIAEMFEKGSLELAPQFQRNSVWTPRDRSLLIESILLGMPLPAVFLYDRVVKGRTRSDVIDGKQRLETVLAFMGYQTGIDECPLGVRISTDRAQSTRRVVYYENLGARQRRVFSAFRMPVVRVEPDEGIGEVIDLFVRLNSTGKRLTGMERRKAQYFESETLNFVQQSAADLLPTYRELGVISATDAARMLHIELTLELLLSLEQQGPLHKKSALDRIVGGDRIERADLKSAVSHLRGALGDLQAIWTSSTRSSTSSSLKNSRFTGKSDFYSLALLFATRRAQGFRLRSDNRKLAHDLLQGLDAQISEVAEAQREFRRAPSGSQLAVRYLATVKEGTDTRHHRVQRAEILSDVLSDDVFSALHSRRRFTAEQKRVLWYRSRQSCECCESPLAFSDVQIDHIQPYVAGGRTSLANGQILCGLCNSRKGAGRPCKHSG